MGACRGVTELRARLWAPLGGRAERLSAKFVGAGLSVSRGACLKKPLL